MNRNIEIRFKVRTMKVIINEVRKYDSDIAGDEFVE